MKSNDQYSVNRRQLTMDRRAFLQGAASVVALCFTPLAAGALTQRPCNIIRVTSEANILVLTETGIANPDSM
ncbi:hypothetical protein GCM10027040_29450 [Halomonas shantousis]